MNTVDGGEVLVTQDGSVLTITINRPERKNAVDTAAWRGLHEAITRAAADDDVRCVVITGAGGDFCAGADLSSDRGTQPWRGSGSVTATGVVTVTVAVAGSPSLVSGTVRVPCAQRWGVQVTSPRPTVGASSPSTAGWSRTSTSRSPAASSPSPTPSPP